MFRQLRFLTRTLVISVLTISALEFNAYHASGGQFAAVSAAGFGGTLAWVIAGGYVLMFVGMILEGPVVTAAASFAAALGYFDIWFVLLLAILGDLIADVGYYWFGYIARSTVVERYGHRLGLSSKRMAHVERLLKNHPWKTFIAIKLTLATPGLIMVGTTRMPFKEFLLFCSLIILPKVLLFVALGYYFGQTYDAIAPYIQNAEYLILFGIILTLIVYYAYNFVSTSLARKLQTI